MLGKIATKVMSCYKIVSGADRCKVISYNNNATNRGFALIISFVPR